MVVLVDYSIAELARQEQTGCDTIPRMAQNDSLRKRQWFLIFSGLIVLLSTMPYLVGRAITPAGFHFTGLLLNPIDGQSYLAKIGQGAGGSWLFTLPYTSEPQQPVFIYPFYLLLGHLAPANSPVVYVVLYHAVRIVFGFLLLVAISNLAGFLFTDARQQKWTFLLIGTSAGLGWLVGSGTDLTVPESFTFYSILVNGHFGLTYLLILMAILGMTLYAGRRGWWLVVLLAGLWLTWIQPVVVPVVGLAAASWLIYQYYSNTGVDWRPVLRQILLFCLVSLPFLGYDLWITRSNPLVARWMSQNLTPSPPVWQWLVGYGFLTPFTLAGVWYALKKGGPADKLLLTWLVSQLVLMLVPIPLQRRLSTGLHLPVCFLAARGFWDVAMPRIRVGWRRLLPAGLIALCVPGNILLMLAGISAVTARNPYVVMSDAQWKAMAWLRENAANDAIVLADEELGTMVPAWGGGARVVYGHPFETVDADSKQETIRRFYNGEMTIPERNTFLEQFNVEYVVVQEDEQEKPPLDGFRPVAAFDPVEIFAVEP